MMTRGVTLTSWRVPQGNGECLFLLVIMAKPANRAESHSDLANILRQEPSFSPRTLEGSGSQGCQLSHRGGICPHLVPGKSK